MTIANTISRILVQAWSIIRTDERGVTTLEYVIAAAIILVVLTAAILTWNNGLADKIGDLVGTLAGT